MKQTWEAVIDWIHRMQKDGDGMVRDRETGKKCDWGQALCREMYGPGWNDDTECREEGLADFPYRTTIYRAERWEAGEWPAWAVRPEVTDA